MPDESVEQAVIEIKESEAVKKHLDTIGEASAQIYVEGFRDGFQAAVTMMEKKAKE